ncbi:hypothetical protein [Tunicatimonas pelagia]|uniref:hypothetical protein n=1 Tax=Tunicatimonas pelagia TaxID=931531 RepID=UPI002665EF94|nr:hypothetical protein [Tunicatimonas pelagia]WKN44421.1 hypothetical protein P0M28_05515 [Tunicatimonas pelagia]
MSDIGLTHGNYEIFNDTLTLNFDGICIRKEYNWANEVDTSAVDYFITDTLLSSFTHRYVTTGCGEKMKLVKVSGDEVGVESSKDYQSFENFLKSEGIIARLTDMMKRLQPISQSSQSSD